MPHPLSLTPGFKLAPKDRKTAVRLLGLLAVLLVLLVGLWLGAKVSALRTAPSDDPRELEAGFQALVEALRVVVGVAKSPVVLALSILEFAALDKSEFGRRLWHWAHDVDLECVPAAKSLVAGVVFAVLLLVNAGLLGGFR